MYSLEDNEKIDKIKSKISNTYQEFCNKNKL